MKKGITAAAAAWMALCGTGAHATATVQEKPCITPAEVQAIFVSIAPGIVRSVRDTCKATLPRTAYLTTRGESLAQRYVDIAHTARPLAIAAFGRLGGEKVRDGLNDAMYEIMIEGMVGPMIVGELKPKDCPLIDRTLELLDPLPPSNMAGVITLLIEVGFKGSKQSPDKKAPPFEICEAKG